MLKTLDTAFCSGSGTKPFFGLFLLRKVTRKTFRSFISNNLTKSLLPAIEEYTVLKSGDIKRAGTASS